MNEGRLLLAFTLKRDGLPPPVGAPLDEDAVPLAHVLVPVLEGDPRLAAAALLPLRAALRLVLGHVARRMLGGAVLADQRQFRAERALQRKRRWRFSKYGLI